MLTQPGLPRIYLPPPHPFAWPRPGWESTYSPPDASRRPSLRTRPLGYPRPGNAGQEALP